MDKSIPVLPSVQLNEARFCASYWTFQCDSFASLFNKTCCIDSLIDHQVVVMQHERWAKEVQHLLARELS